MALGPRNRISVRLVRQLRSRPTTNPATRPPPTQRPDHHQPSDQTTTKLVDKIASREHLCHSDQVVRVNPTPLGKLFARHSEASVTEALTDTRVVLITGARQCGKSTLLGLVAKGREAEWRNLDRPATRQAALTDPA